MDPVLTLVAKATYETAEDGTVLLGLICYDPEDPEATLADLYSMHGIEYSTAARSGFVVITVMGWQQADAVTLQALNCSDRLFGGEASDRIVRSLEQRRTSEPFEVHLTELNLMAHTEHIALLHSLVRT